MKKIFTILLCVGLVSTTFASDHDKKNGKTSKVETVSMTGTIVDELTGEAISGAEISVKGSKMSVYTDINGNYTLNLPQGSHNLTVSFISYKDATVVISTAKKMIDIELTEE